jgi:hypothetical protein
VLHAFSMRAMHVIEWWWRGPPYRRSGAPCVVLWSGVVVLWNKGVA